MKRDRTFLLRFSILLALLLGFLFSAESFAGTADTDFSAIVTKLNDWATGTLGRVLALAIFVVGIAMGALSNSPSSPPPWRSRVR